MAQHQAPMTAGAIYASIASLSPAQQTMLTEISKHSDPVTVTQLAANLGLHPNSVRATLDSLSRMRLIDRQVIKSGGRGRPSWGYYALAPDTESLASAQMVELTHIFCDAIREYADDPVAEARRIGSQWGDRVLENLSGEADADHVHDALDLSTQISQLRVLYTSLGTAATINRDFPHVIDLHSCPFVNRQGQVDPLICEMHRGLISRVMESNYDSTIVGRLYPMPAPGVCKIEIEEVASA